MFGPLLNILLIEAQKLLDDDVPKLPPLPLWINQGIQRQKTCAFRRNRSLLMFALIPNPKIIRLINY